MAEKVHSLRLSNTLRLMNVGLVSPLSRGPLLLYSSWFLILLHSGFLFLTGPLVKEVACTVTCNCSGDDGSVLSISKLVTYLALTTAVLLLGLVSQSLSRYLANRAGLHMRKNLVLKLHEKYLCDKNFYDVICKEKKVDNPDQRITSDVHDFVESIISLQANIIGAILSIGVYTYQTITTLGLFALLIPFSWCFLGGLVSYFLARRVPSVEYALEKREGDLRFSHMRVRTYAESIAFFGGETQEKSTVDNQIHQVIRANLKLYNRLLSLKIVQNILASGAVMIPYVIPFIGFFKSQKCTLNTGDLVFMISIVRNLVQELADLPENFSTFGTLGGLAARVGQLYDVLEEITKANKSEDSKAVRDSDYIALDNVDVTAPGGQLLIRNLSFAVEKGRSIVITGPSGVGKSSILKTIAGLWSTKIGTVYRPPLNWSQIFFVPQRSYLGVGTLRQQIMYPKQEDQSVLDFHLFDILRQVGLMDLLKKYTLDSEIVWEEVLSPGESQRIGFARVLFHKPQYVFLDESTSALDLETEMMCMKACLETGTTLISIAHRPTVLPYHKIQLEVRSDQSYVVTNIN